MNEEKARFQNQIISKKTKNNDEEHHGKKEKKHKKNQQNQSVVTVQQLEEKGSPNNERKRKGGTANHERQSDEKIFSELCAVLSEYKQGTILKILEQTNFDKEVAYSRLLMIPPDNPKEEQEWIKEMQKMNNMSKKKSEDMSTSSGPSEVANNLMSEVFDTLLNEEINGREFEELFEEIAEMIKEDQKEKGVGMLEINSFVDECQIIKKTLLVGFRQQLSNFDDFQFDQTSPLFSQIQLFVDNIISKQVKEEKRLEEDFPILDSSPCDQKSIIDKIKQQNKFKKEQEHFFTPSKNSLPKFALQKHNDKSIFNVDNKYNSQRDLISLHKEFEDVPIIDLKFIYKALAGDYNKTVEFLIKHYDSKKNYRVVEIKTVSYQQHVPAHKKMHTSHMREEQIDKQLQHLSLDEIRDQLDHLYKLRQAFKLTKMKIKNNNQRKELDRIGNQNEPWIRKLSHAARIKTIQLMIKKDPLYVDLHGYREEQIDDLLQAISRMVNEQLQLGNEKVRVRTIRGRRTACLIMMTGKGIHSRGNRSILKPSIVLWCQENGIDFDEEVDHVKVYVVVK